MVLSDSILLHIVKASSPVIIGYPTCRALKLITLSFAIDVLQIPTSLQESRLANQSCKPIGNYVAKADVLRKYKDRFEGANELDKLEKQSIVGKVDKPTDWVNSTVCTAKPRDGIRLCLDPKDPNKAIKRPHHVTRTLGDDILPKQNGAKYFSILDARSGYWDIELDEESSYYTTFTTPFGRYWFLRLPFGLVCAQDIFQKKVDKTFADLPGVTGIADDIVIVGYSAGLEFNPD